MNADSFAPSDLAFARKHVAQYKAGSVLSKYDAGGQPAFPWNAAVVLGLAKIVGTRIVKPSCRDRLRAEKAGGCMNPHREYTLEVL